MQKAQPKKTRWKERCKLWERFYRVQQSFEKCWIQRKYLFGTNFKTKIFFSWLIYSYLHYIIRANSIEITFVSVCRNNETRRPRTSGIFSTPNHSSNKIVLSPKIFTNTYRMELNLCQLNSVNVLLHLTWTIILGKFCKKNPFDLNIFLSHMKYGRKITRFYRLMNKAPTDNKTPRVIKRDQKVKWSHLCFPSVYQWYPARTTPAISAPPAQTSSSQVQALSDFA